jgi:hypothetical protein
VSPIWRHSIDCCFVSRSLWHNQVSSVVTNRDRKSFGSRRRNSKRCSDDWHRWRFYPHSCIGDPLRGELPHVKSSWMMDPTRSREMPSCSAMDLAEIRRSSKISSWIWAIKSVMVTVWGGPGRGASRANIHRLLTGPISFWRSHSMEHVPLMFLSDCLEFPSAPCLAGKKYLMTARFSMLLKSRASRDMLPFSLCSKKRLAIRHMNRPLFPTALSISSYDNGK